MNAKTLRTVVGAGIIISEECVKASLMSKIVERLVDTVKVSCNCDKFD